LLRGGKEDTPAEKSHSQRNQIVTGSYREIMLLTGPLVLSFTGILLMQIIDAVFLARYSEDAVAAAVSAGMANFMVSCMFLGMVGYTSTFVAQYVGSQQPARVGVAVWQGLYLALACGIMIAVGGTLIAGPLFHWVNHQPEIQGLEVMYFKIMCWGAPASLLATALSSFFSGRGDNKTLMAAQLAGLGLNGFLSYGLIFGTFHLPALGTQGAALSAVLGQVLIVLLLAPVFFAPAYRRRFQTWEGRNVDLALLKRVLRLGSFNGLRTATEIFTWTIFLFFVGRLGKDEQAVTSIVFRINGLSFLPPIGLSIAIATLVGHAQGARQPKKAELVTWRGLAIAEAWMLFAAALFVLLPHPLLSLFVPRDPKEAEHFAVLAETGVVLLRFVALYCLLDGMNVIVLSSLQGAGDTSWTLYASFIMNLIFLAALLALDRLNKGLYAFWGAATAFVMLQALVWLVRFRSGKWKTMQVIEPTG
jgi:MATE family multidrug resistance protein